eukprot:XP_011680222.1 PREDICTED: uncharacterized protein LOC105445850 [Strongylocentrotus purpuratus]
MNVSQTVVCDGLYHCDRYEDELACGTGNDPSDVQSVITTFNGFRNTGPDDVYVVTNEMWIAAIGAKSDSGLQMDVGIISIDLSTLFACSSSNMNVSLNVVCDGLYHCDRYEDELACDNSAAFLQEGESHFIFLPYTATLRLYNATLLQTNATDGFKVVFRYLYLKNLDVTVEIGTGNDPSDIQSVITTFNGFRNTTPDDVYVDTNEMWIAAIGAKSDSGLQIDVRIISIDLSTLFACSSSNMNVSHTVLCDGLYHCDRYEDELACVLHLMRDKEQPSSEIAILIPSWAWQPVPELEVNPNLVT